MKISFVIPCYRSEHMIGQVVSEINKTMSEDYDYEIILVNDCSPDNTFQTIKGLCKEQENIIGIDLAKNFGQHSALMAGFHYVSGDIIVCMDDDGQTPPSEAHKLIDALNDEDTDVAYAEYPQKKHSVFRNFGSMINSKMAQYLIGKPKALYVSSYFAAKRFVIDEMVAYKNPYPYVIGLVLRTTKNIVNVEVNHCERQEGSSGYTMKKLLGLWFNGFTAFSVKPLRVATVTGVVFGIAGFLYLIYTVINKFLNPNVPLGWSSTMAVLLVVGGCILFMLGLIGEYIGRIYISLNNSPQYVVKKVIKKEENGNEGDTD